jgi:hypothetical protein
MIKTIILFFCILLTIAATAQSDFIVLKKRHKTIAHYYAGSIFTFQNEYGQWFNGVINKISRDSFYFTQYIIHYYMTGPDTARYRGLQFSVKDVRALPRKNATVVFRGETTAVDLGREKWVWVRDGTLFQVLGGGYAVLNIINTSTQGSSPFASDNIGKLSIGVGLFLVGTFMHMNFDEYIKLGKKYRLETSSTLSN